MAKLRERLRARFAGAKADEPQTPATAPAPATTKRAAPRGRRQDYKGERARLNLRISAELARDLELLRLATGVDKNVVCEDILRSVIAERVAAEKQRLGTAAWEVIARCARGKGREPVAGEQPGDRGDHS